MKNCLLLCASVLLLASCSSKKTDLSYDPIITPSQPKNITVALTKFEDAREDDEIGCYRSYYNARAGGLKSTTDIVEWITNAIKTECKNAGYLISENPDKANIQIKGKVTHVYADTGGMYNGKVRIKLKAHDDQGKLFAKTYTGQRSAGLNWAMMLGTDIGTSSGSKKALNKSLQSVCRRFIADLEKNLPKNLLLASNEKKKEINLN